jgi:anthranilate phosphoribosyltransferase
VDISRNIKHVADGGDVSYDEMTKIMTEMMSGAISDVQIAAFLIALKMKEETIDEISASVTVMRKFAIKVDAGLSPLIDTCGTGGDGSSSFNISTAAAFVTAACGGLVAKHGNRAASSASGSADVLEAAGALIELEPEQVAQCIRATGIGFMFAPAHHGATRYAGKVRKQIGARTLFNILGPMTNPAGADRQIIGVFSPTWVSKIAEVLKTLGSKHALIVCGGDGMDEISISAPTTVAEVKMGAIRHFQIEPNDFNIKKEKNGQALMAASASESLTIISQVFSGEEGPAHNIVSLNAGAALYVGGLVSDLNSGVQMASNALIEGKAAKKFSEFITYTNTFK